MVGFDWIFVKSFSRRTRYAPLFHIFWVLAIAMSVYLQYTYFGSKLKDAELCTNVYLYLLCNNYANNIGGT